MGQEFELNIDDVVDDADIHQPMNQNDNLQKQLDDKVQLIRDLNTNLSELSENRRRELLHFQQQLEAMKGRCREWYQQLMQRVALMEAAYNQALQKEVDDKEQQFAEKWQSEMEKMQKSKISHAEIDELSRENARLNEELEKFKGKYFDSEQKKIELNDAVDDIREEKFKMEAKLEEMANKISESQQMNIEDVSSNNKDE